MLRSPRALLIALCLTALVPGGATVARAQEATKEELDRARKTYQRGLSLEAAGDWAAALEKFEEVAKVRLTPQVRFHIGRCKENLGRLTEALGDYRLAEYEATEQKLKEVDEIAAAREALEARVPRLTVRLAPGAPRPRITLDGVELGAAKLGEDQFLEPGEHTLVVRWRGGKRRQERLVLAPGDRKEVVLEPPPGLRDEEEPEEPEEPAPSADEQQPAAPTPASEERSVLPWIVGGVGVASLGASAFFYTQRNTVEADLKGKCRGDVCPSALAARGDEGKRFALLTNVTLGLGLVAVGTAVVLLVTESGSPPRESAPAARRLRLDVVSDHATTGVSLSGRF